MYLHGSSILKLLLLLNPMCLSHIDQLSCVSPWQQYSEAPLLKLFYFQYTTLCVCLTMISSAVYHHGSSILKLLLLLNPMCLPHHDQLSCVSPWQQYSEAPPTSQVILFSVYNSMCLPHHDQLSCVSPWQQYSEAPPTSQPYVFVSHRSAQLCISMAAVF